MNKYYKIYISNRINKKKKVLKEDNIIHGKKERK